MGKHSKKHSKFLQTHHLYLGVGGMLAVAALVVALTFGLSSAQDPNMPPPPPGDNSPTGDMGGTPPPATYTPPPPTGDTTQPPPTGGTMPPPSGNYSGDPGTGFGSIPPPTGGANCSATSNYPNVPPPPDKDCYGNPVGGTPLGGTMLSPPGGTPTIWCPTQSRFVMTQSECSGGTMPPIGGDLSQSQCTAQGKVWCTGTNNSSWCQQGPCAAPIGVQQQPTGCETPTTLQCGANITPVCMNNAWGCPNTNIQSTGSVQCTPPKQPFPGSNGQMACYDPAILPTCGPAVSSPCKPQGWASPTTTQMPGQTPSCPQDQWWDFAQNKCLSGTMQPPSGTTVTTPQQPGQQPDQGGQYPQPGMRPTTPPMSPSFKPGECPESMQKCPDQWNPANTVCMPKKMFWDSKTQKNIPEGKDATCEDFQAPTATGQGPMGGFGGPGAGFGGQGGFEGGPGDFGRPSGFGRQTGQGGPSDPCASRPNDPFCRAGFDFGGMKQGFQFDRSEFQFDESQFQGKNTKQVLRDIRQESKHYERDLVQVRQQRKEVSSESSGFACPIIVEVDAIADEMQKFIDAAKNLNNDSSADEIGLVKAQLDHIRGTYDPETGEQTSGLQAQLFGGGIDEETGEPKPGKMQSLGVCREISNVIQESCSMAKNLGKEFARAKKGKAPEEILKVFEETIAELNQRCSNPLGALQELGVSWEDLVAPWQPDPEVCGFGGFMPMGGPGGFGGGPGDFGVGGQGPMFGPGDFGGFENNPEMMKLMKEKFQEFGQQGRFGGGFGGQGGQGGNFNPFGTSVLSAQLGDDDFEGFDDFEGEEGEFGMPPEEPEEECMPPVQRYLSPFRLMRKLDEARMSMDKQADTMSICGNMLDMVKAYLDEGGNAEDEFGPPEEIIDLVESGEWDAACELEEGDEKEKALKRIKNIIFRQGGRPGRPGMRGSSLGSMVDIDKLVKEKFKEKLDDHLFGEDSGDTGDESDLAKKLKEAEARLATLTSKLDFVQTKLDDASKTIIALNEKLSEMITKFAVTVNQPSEEATAAINNIAKLPEGTVQQTVAANITAVADKVNDVKAVLPKAIAKEASKLLDSLVNALVQSPPTEAVINDIINRLTEIQSYAASGAKPAEVLAKVKEAIASIAVTNAADVNNKVAEGQCASKDTCNYSEWFSVPALNAVNEGFASITKDNSDFKPGEPETKAAAIVRFARIMEKAGELEIDMDNKEPVAGAPEWSRPFIHAMQEKGVPFVENLNDPNAPANRLDIAILVHDALGDNLPDPPKEQLDKYLTPDVKDLPADQQAAIAEARFNGIMDKTDGTNFSPKDGFNRAQNAVVSTKAYEALQAAKEELVGESNPSPAP